MGRASGGSNTPPHWIRNNILHFLRAMSVKIVATAGGICDLVLELGEEMGSKSITIRQFSIF